MTWSIRAIKGLPVDQIDLEKNHNPLINAREEGGLAACLDIISGFSNKNSHSVDTKSDRYALLTSVNALCTLILWTEQTLKQKNLI